MLRSRINDRHTLLNYNNNNNDNNRNNNNDMNKTTNNNNGNNYNNNNYNENCNYTHSNEAVASTEAEIKPLILFAPEESSNLAHNSSRIFASNTGLRPFNRQVWSPTNSVSPQAPWTYQPFTLSTYGAPVFIKNEDEEEEDGGVDNDVCLNRFKSVDLYFDDTNNNRKTNDKSKRNYMNTNKSLKWCNECYRMSEFPETSIDGIKVKCPKNEIKENNNNNHIDNVSSQIRPDITHSETITRFRTLNTCTLHLQSDFNTLQLNTKQNVSNRQSGTFNTFKNKNTENTSIHNTTTNNNSSSFKSVSPCFIDTNFNIPFNHIPSHHPPIHSSHHPSTDPSFQSSKTSSNIPEDSIPNSIALINPSTSSFPHSTEEAKNSTRDFDPEHSDLLLNNNNKKHNNINKEKCDDDKASKENNNKINENTFLDKINDGDDKKKNNIKTDVASYQRNKINNNENDKNNKNETNKSNNFNINNINIDNSEYKNSNNNKNKNIENNKNNNNNINNNNNNNNNSKNKMSQSMARNRQTTFKTSKFSNTLLTDV